MSAQHLQRHWWLSRTWRVAAGDFATFALLGQGQAPHHRQLVSCTGPLPGRPFLEPSTLRMGREIFRWSENQRHDQIRGVMFDRNKDAEYITLPSPYYKCHLPHIETCWVSTGQHENGPLASGQSFVHVFCSTPHDRKNKSYMFIAGQWTC